MDLNNLKQNRMAEENKKINNAIERATNSNNVKVLEMQNDHILFSNNYRVKTLELMQDQEYLNNYNNLNSKIALTMDLIKDKNNSLDQIIQNINNYKSKMSEIVKKQSEIKVDVKDFKKYQLDEDMQKEIFKQRMQLKYVEDQFVHISNMKENFNKLDKNNLSITDIEVLEKEFYSKFSKKIQKGEEVREILTGVTGINYFPNEFKTIIDKIKNDFEQNNTIDLQKLEELQNKFNEKHSIIENNLQKLQEVNEFTNKTLKENSDKIEKKSDTFEIEFYSRDKEGKFHKNKMNLLDEFLEINDEKEIRRRIDEIIEENVKYRNHNKSIWVGDTLKRLSDEAQSKGKNFGDMSALDYISFYKMGFYFADIGQSISIISRNYMDKQKLLSKSDEVLNEINKYKKEQNLLINNQFDLTTTLKEQGLTEEDLNSLEEQFKKIPGNENKSFKDNYEEAKEFIFNEKILNINETAFNRENIVELCKLNNNIKENIDSFKNVYKNFDIERIKGVTNIYDNKELEEYIIKYKLDNGIKTKELDDLFNEKLNNVINSQKDFITFNKSVVIEFVKNDELIKDFNSLEKVTLDNIKNNIKYFDKKESEIFMKEYEDLKSKTSLTNEEERRFEELEKEYGKYLYNDKNFQNITKQYSDKDNPMSDIDKKIYVEQMFVYQKMIDSTKNNLENNLKIDQDNLDLLDKLNKLYSNNNSLEVLNSKIINQLSEEDLIKFTKTFKLEDKLININDLKKELNKVDLEISKNKLEQELLDTNNKINELFENRKLNNPGDLLTNKSLEEDNLYNMKESLLNRISEINKKINENDSIINGDLDSRKKYLEETINNNQNKNYVLDEIEFYSKQEIEKNIKKITKDIEEKNDLIKSIERTSKEFKEFTNISEEDLEKIQSLEKIEITPTLLNNKSYINKFNNEVDLIVQENQDKIIENNEAYNGLNSSLPLIVANNIDIGKKIEDVNKTQKDLSIVSSSIANKAKNLNENILNDNTIPIHQKDEVFKKALESNFNSMTNDPNNKALGHILMGSLKKELANTELKSDQILAYLSRPVPPFDEDLKNILTTFLTEKDFITKGINELKQGGFISKDINPNDLLTINSNNELINSYQNATNNLMKYLSERQIDPKLLNIDEMISTLNKQYDKDNEKVKKIQDVFMEQKVLDKLDKLDQVKKDKEKEKEKEKELKEQQKIIIKEQEEKEKDNDNNINGRDM